MYETRLTPIQQRKRSTGTINKSHSLNTSFLPLQTVMCMNLAETEAVGHFKFQLISKISKEVWVWLRVKELRLFPLCTNISVNRLIYQVGIQPLKSPESLGLKSPKNKNLAWLIQTFQLRSKHSTLGMPK